MLIAKDIFDCVVSTFLLAVILCCLSYGGCVGCAHATKVAEPAKGLNMGLVKGCGLPSASVDGILTLDKDLFMNNGEGQTSAVYVGEVLLGTRMLCMMGMRQDTCHGPWAMVNMHCIPWDDSYQVYINKLTGDPT